MELGIQPQNLDIKKLILSIRGTQVLLDSDVAMLYGYETKRINEVASRNKARFPESFRFRLSKIEYEEFESSRSQLSISDSSALRSQNATLKLGQGEHSKYLPYAYSEQGIAMLSGLLKNSTAIQVSIGIMNAFVEMRRFISVYDTTFQRLTSVEYRLMEHDKRFDEVFDLFQLQEIPRQGVLFEGMVYDAFKLLMSIIKKATASIVIIDNYADNSVIEMLEAKVSSVEAFIITAHQDRISRQHIKKFNQQYPTLKLIDSKVFHDRFVIVDNTTVYHLGASLKDLGKKCFALSIIEDNVDLIAKVCKLL